MRKISILDIDSNTVKPTNSRELWDHSKCPLKVAEHSFQVPMPDSPLLLNHLCYGAHFLQESRLTTEVFILTF